MTYDRIGIKRGRCGGRSESEREEAGQALTQGVPDAVQREGNHKGGYFS